MHRLPTSSLKGGKAVCRRRRGFPLERQTPNCAVPRAWGWRFLEGYRWQNLWFKFFSQAERLLPTWIWCSAECCCQSCGSLQMPVAVGVCIFQLDLAWAIAETERDGPSKSHSLVSWFSWKWSRRQSRKWRNILRSVFCALPILVSFLLYWLRNHFAYLKLKEDLP